MSASKSCPACQKQWAGTFKFCPEDGALLVVLNAADTVLQTPAAPEPAPAPQRAPAVAPFTGSDTVVVTAVPVHDTDEFAILEWLQVILLEGCVPIAAGPGSRIAPCAARCLRWFQ